MLWMFVFLLYTYIQIHKNKNVRDIGRNWSANSAERWNFVGWQRRRRTVVVPRRCIVATDANVLHVDCLLYTALNKHAVIHLLINVDRCYVNENGQVVKFVTCIAYKSYDCQQSMFPTVSVPNCRRQQWQSLPIDVGWATMRDCRRHRSAPTSRANPTRRRARRHALCSPTCSGTRCCSTTYIDATTLLIDCQHAHLHSIVCCDRMNVGLFFCSHTTSTHISFKRNIVPNTNILHDQRGAAQPHSSTSSTKIFTNQTIVDRNLQIRRTRIKKTNQTLRYKKHFYCEIRRRLNIQRSS
jgi:hypothetical protein